MKFKGLPESVPSSEFSEEFAQGMADRMAVSFFKYGYAKNAAGKVDFIKSMQMRLDLYLHGGKTKGGDVGPGNTEYLMDAANFLMMEFMHPSVPGAHFTPTDSSGSPGRDRLGIATDQPNIVEFKYQKVGD
jgi:hypothetical protein